MALRLAWRCSTLALGAGPLLQQFAPRQPLSTAQDVVRHWQQLLAGPQMPQQQVTTDMLRHLVQAAVRVQDGSDTSAVLPQEVASTFMAAYQLLLPSKGRVQLMCLLAQDFGVQAADVDQAVANWTSQAAQQTDALRPERVGRASERLRGACEPVYHNLLHTISQQPRGIGFLVHLHADLLAALQRPQLAAGEAAALRSMSTWLRRCLSTWFSPGLLQLRGITWDNSSAALLESVLHSDAVHPMTTLEHLKPRLDPTNRRCFAYFHPSLPEVPLVVLHTALMHEVPDSMEQILGDGIGSDAGVGAVAPAAAASSSAMGSSGSSSTHSGISTSGGSRGEVSNSSSTSSGRLPSVACFYSISSTQPGLSGVDLGTNLIKTVAKKLQQELPSVTCLVTLSPMPGFRAWLHVRLQQQIAKESSLAAQQPSADSAAAPPPATAAPAPAAPATAAPAPPPLPAAAEKQQAPWDPGLQLLSDQDLDLLSACWQALGTDSPQEAADPAPAADNLQAAATDSSRSAVGAAQHPQPPTQQLQPSSSSLYSSTTAAAGSLGSTKDSAQRIRSDNPSAAQLLQALLQGDAWQQLPQDLQEQLGRQVLLRLAAVYLLREKRRNLVPDPVGNFHVRNGAQVWRLCWRADLSGRGLQRSHGIMVNYLYDLDQVPANNKAYLLHHQVAASPQVAALLQQHDTLRTVG